MNPGTSTGFNWTVHVSPASTKIVFTGEFDLAAAAGLRERLDDTLAATERTLVLALDLAFMDSTGLRFLLDVKRCLDGRGVDLVLERVSPPVQRVLDVAGLASFFEHDARAASR